MDSDLEERELERLVFGNDAEFNNGISEFSRSVRTKLAPSDQLSDEDEVPNKNGLEDLDDADIFMVDTVGSQALAQYSAEILSSDEEDSHGVSNMPAWHDSDDERIQVSLASNNRLRKLRRTEDEDVINGKEYSRRLRQQFEKLNPAPEWFKEAMAYTHRQKRRKTTLGEEATSDDSSDGDVSEDEASQPLARLLRSANGLVKRDLVKSKKRKLRPEVIDIQRMKHICNNGPSAITSLQTHSTLPLLIASGPSSKMDLYHLHSQPPDYASLLTTLVIKHTALTTTAFHPKTSDPRIFLSARRRYFHVWNLSTGRVEKISRIYGHGDEQRSMERFKPSPDGENVAFLGTTRKGGGVINILSMSTLQWVAQARVESRGGIAEFEWWQDSSGLCIIGKNGAVTEWSLAERKAVAEWQDEGGVGTTVLALGGRSGRADLGGDAWVATGSSSGIVNLYSRRSWFADATSDISQQENGGVPTHPKPTRTLDQLTTPTSHLSFSPDGQLLVMASRWKKDALRMIHLPSCSVYRNWPTANTPFGRISAVCWGEVEGVPKLLVGNEAGRIMCWEIRK